MTTNPLRNQIAALIEAVEAGSLETISAYDIKQATGRHCQLHVVGAYNGSLDAAKALHEALLPRWVVKLRTCGEGSDVIFSHCTVEEWETGEECVAINIPDGARAWLLAILKAHAHRKGAE